MARNAQGEIRSLRTRDAPDSAADGHFACQRHARDLKRPENTLVAATFHAFRTTEPCLQTTRQFNARCFAQASMPAEATSV